MEMLTSKCLRSEERCSWANKEGGQPYALQDKRPFQSQTRLDVEGILDVK